jgi:hypothetical protein
MGESGTGKTSSILTLLKMGLKVNVLVTEGNGVEILLDALARERRAHPGLDDSLLHWKLVTPSNMDYDTMLRKVALSNRLGAGALQALETGLDRDKYPQFMNMLRSCQNFISDRDGSNQGNTAAWGDDTAFVVDSMTGVNQMVVQHVCGMRPTMTQPEYGIVQNHLRDLYSLWTSLSCFFVMTAHMEKETLPLTGEVKIMASSVGKALAPELPRPFSEVILTELKGTQFTWSTSDPRTVLKSRSLERRSGLKADFAPIVEAYRHRKEMVAAGLDPESPVLQTTQETTEQSTETNY